MKKITVIVNDDIVATLIGLIAEHAIELHVRAWVSSSADDQLLKLPTPAAPNVRDGRVINKHTRDVPMGSVKSGTKHIEKIKMEDQMMMLLEDAGNAGMYYPVIEMHFVEKGFSPSSPRSSLSSLIRNGRVVAVGSRRKETFYHVLYSPQAQAS